MVTKTTKRLNNKKTRGKFDVSDDIKRELEEFLYQEVGLLDDRLFEEWMSLFTEDGFYWVPIIPGQESHKTHFSLFSDDRAGMETRITRLRHPRLHAQIPHTRTRHLVSNVRVKNQNKRKKEYLVSANFIMVEYRADKQNMYGGEYVYEISHSGSELKIKTKKVDLINCDGTFPPLSVYF